MSSERHSTPRDPDLRMPPNLTCEVCGKEPAKGVAAMPGVPYSAAYGEECLRTNAHPYDMLVANTAAIRHGYPDTADEIDVLADTADWWRVMVEDTLVRLRKTRETFDRDVYTAVRTMAEAENDAHTRGDIGD